VNLETGFKWLRIGFNFIDHSEFFENVIKSSGSIELENYFAGRIMSSFQGILPTVQFVSQRVN
jgi:hypothetical protein